MFEKKEKNVSSELFVVCCIGCFIDLVYFVKINNINDETPCNFKTLHEAKTLQLSQLDKGMCQSY